MHGKPEVRPLGELLVAAGVISRADLDQALEHRRRRGTKIGQALVELGLVNESQLAAALKEQGKILCIELNPEIVDPAVAKELGEDFSRQRNSIAINRIAGVTTVAMEDPLDVYSVDDIAKQLNTRVLAVHADPSLIRECIGDAFHRKANDPDASALEDILSLAKSESVNFDIQEFDGELGEEELEGPVMNLIQAFLSEAFEARASDIHLEPRKGSFVVRFRVDGACYDRLKLGKGWARPCVTRLKVMSNLDIAQRRLPQDGRTQVEINGHRVDLRVATSPTLMGEAAVVRILDGGRGLKNVGSLGLRPEQEGRLRRMIEARDGFMLAVGPTGSGKTTTLYALLQELNTPDRKIITLEDPVENQLEGLSQINTNPKAGLSFARGLRSILRQDPDVVLVGEVRDQETAEIAIQAALTGHMVLSTLHTVGSVETITRLRDMGIEPFLMADTLRGICAQRLVRRVCNHCKEPAEPAPDLLERLGIDPAGGGTFHVGEGCPRCNGTGYFGRMGLYEVMTMSEALSDALRHDATTDEIKNLALGEGMTTLRDEGIQRARQGLTTLQEILAMTSRV